MRSVSLICKCSINFSAEPEPARLANMNDFNIGNGILLAQKLKHGTNGIIKMQQLIVIQIQINSVVRTRFNGAV